MQVSLMATTRPLAPRGAPRSAAARSPTARLPSLRPLAAEPAAEAAAAPESSTEVVASSTPPPPVPMPADNKVEVAKGDRFRVYQAMLGKGWPKTWCDIVLDKMIKADIDTTPEQFLRLAAFLQAIGIQPLDFCFMAAVAPGIMGRTAEQASVVAKYVSNVATSDGAIATVLRDHPKLLEYDFDPALGLLAKRKGEGGVGGAVACAAVNRVGPGSKVGVSFFRDGAIFGSAPVSPFLPKRFAKGADLDKVFKKGGGRG